MGNPDPYYMRTEVSNSDLTALKEMLSPQTVNVGREAAFRLGTLVDALVTEPGRVDYVFRTVDGEPYSDDEFRHAEEMRRALRAESRSDRFLYNVLRTAETQRCMARRGQTFGYCGFPFALDTRCKWDWFLPAAGFGGDLKTTSARTQDEFEECVDRFDWDRSRAWYMDVARSGRDFIYAVSKKNFRVFKKFIVRDDDTYRAGRGKYEELAFQYWCLCPKRAD